MEAAEFAGREQENKVKITGLETGKKSCLIVGLPSKFCSEKIPRIGSEQISLFRGGKSASFAEIHVSLNSPFRGSERNETEWNSAKK